MLQNKARHGKTFNLYFSLNPHQQIYFSEQKKSIENQIYIGQIISNSNNNIREEKKMNYMYK